MPRWFLYVGGFSLAILAMLQLRTRPSPKGASFYARFVNLGTLWSLVCFAVGVGLVTMIDPEIGSERAWSAATAAVGCAIFYGAVGFLLNRYAVRSKRSYGSEAPRARRRWPKACSATCRRRDARTLCSGLRRMTASLWRASDAELLSLTLSEGDVVDFVNQTGDTLIGRA